MLWHTVKAKWQKPKRVNAKKAMIQKRANKKKRSYEWNNNMSEDEEKEEEEKKVSHHIKSQTVMTSITYIVNYCANKQTKNKSLFVIIITIMIIFV